MPKTVSGVIFTENLLVVCSSAKNEKSIAGLAESFFSYKTTFARSGQEARRLIAQNDFDTAVINSPLSDENGVDLAMTLSEKYPTGVVLLASAEFASDFQHQTENYGVMVVEKPINRTLFYNSVRLLNVARRKASGIRHQSVNLESKISEMRMVERAKAALMSRLSMTEDQAHKYILRQAMDMRATKAEIAKNIIRTYEY